MGLLIFQIELTYTSENHNMNLNLLKQIKYLINKNEKNEFEAAKNFLLNYLLENPTASDAWLLLAILECNSTEDSEKITEYANNILVYDTSNAYALLFLAYAKYYYLRSQIDEETYKKLCFAKSDDPELMAMIEVAKARYFEDKNDIENYEKSLQKSIAYSSNQQMNFSMLGILYLNQGQFEAGKTLIKKGLMNVKKISASENIDAYDPVNIITFFDEFYAGTIIRDTRYSQLKSLIQ